MPQETLELVRVSVASRREPKGVKPKMREDKLKSGVKLARDVKAQWA